MRLHLAISAVLLTAAQAAPSSYLEKAKAILSRAIFPCTDYNPQNCMNSGPALEETSQPYDIPTRTYWIEDSAQTAPNPVPVTAPEVASDMDNLLDKWKSPAPASHGNERKGINNDDNPPPDNLSDGINLAADHNPPKAICYEYKSECLLCWDSSDGSRKCKYFLPQNGWVCADERDSDGKQICAYTPPPGK